MGKQTTWLLVLLLAWLGNPSPAAAAERIAILVMGADARLDRLADQCTEVLVAAIAAKEQAEIVGREEFAARLSLEGREALMDCLQEKTCLARAETTIGLESLVIGYLGGEGDTYRLTLMRTDTSGEVLRTAKKEFPAHGAALLEGIGPMVDELYSVTDAELRVETSVPGARIYLDDRPVGTSPITLPKVSIGAHTLRVELDGYVTHRQALDLGEAGAVVRVTMKSAHAPKPAPKRTVSATPRAQAPKPKPPETPEPTPAPEEPEAARHSHLLLGLGAATLVTFGIGGVLHALSYGDSLDYQSETDPGERDSIKERGEARWTGAVVFYGLGLAMAAGTGVAYVLEDPPQANAVTVLPLPGGGLVSLRLTF